MDKLRLSLFLLIVPLGLLHKGHAEENQTSNPVAHNRGDDHSSAIPRKFTAEIEGTNSLKLTWQAPRTADNDCPVRRYMVRLREQGATQSKTWKVDGARDSFSLHDLLEDKTYHIRLMAVTCEGKGRRTKWIQVRTGISQSTLLSTNDEHLEVQAPGKPMYVRTRTLVDSVIVSWEAPEEAAVVRGYKVGYSEGVPDLNWRYVDASQRNATIDDLKPATEYVISLCAFNSYGQGPVVYELVYTRDIQGADPGPFNAPENVRAKVLSATTVWLQWSDPSLGAHQILSDNRYYNVHYQALPNGKTLSVIVKALHVVLYDMTPGTTYAFKVRTVKESFSSRFSEMARNRTFEAVPSTAPRMLAVVKTNDSATVHLTWRPPREPNGYITAYLVLYATNEDTAVDAWDVFGVPGANTQVIISTLSANTTYFFKVQARNSRGYGPVSNTLVYEIRSTSNPVYTNRKTETGKEDRRRNDVHFEEEGNLLRFEEYGDEMLGDEFDPAYNNGVFERLVQPENEDDIAVYGYRGEVVSGSHQSDTTEEQLTALRTASHMQDHNKFATHNAPQGHTTGTLDVSFQFVVKHTVMAVVRWETACQDSNNSQFPVTYKIRYYPQDVPSMYAEKSTPTNFVLLNNLKPNQKYAYVVKQISERELESDWSDEGFLDTSYPHK